MEVLIIIKYGVNETSSIDVTKNIMDNYCKNHIINIPVAELINFTNKFQNEFLNIYGKEDTTQLVKFLFININNTKFIINTISKMQNVKDININILNVVKKGCNHKNIIIYPHTKYSQGDGGINVLYYLAKQLSLSGKNVRIYPNYGIIDNPHYNKYYNNDFDLTNSIVVYCEGTLGNPLCSKYVIRWMLSELGKNVPYNSLYTWDSQELVYYFNTENRIESKPELKGKIYKILPLIIVPSLFKNNGNNRISNSFCYTIRKGNHMRQKISFVHPPNSFEITRHHTHSDLYDIFNKYAFFVSYDPLTFITFMAALCGCVSYVDPLPNMSKLEWLKTTACYDYLSNKNLSGYYGVAYGLEELEWAKSTIHLVKEQWEDILSYNNKYFNAFLEDLAIFESRTLLNTIENNYLK
jgi:hypothetical protein